MKILPDATSLPQPVVGPAKPTLLAAGGTPTFEAMLGDTQSDGSRPNSASPRLEREASDSVTIDADSGVAPLPDDIADAVATAAETPSESPVSAPDVPFSTAALPAMGQVTAAAVTDAATKPSPDLSTVEPKTIDRGSAAAKPKPDPHGPARPLLHRAFGFSELGVWGHSGFTDVGHPDRSCGVPAGKPDAGRDLGSLISQGLKNHRGLGEGAQPRWRGSEASSVPPGLDPRRTVGNRPASASPSDRSMVHARRGPTRTATVHVSSANAEESADFEQLEQVHRRAASARPDRDAALKLQVSETAAGLQIGAVMADINPESVARLRRLAESLAREFGLSLARFSLNGVDLSATSDRINQWR